MMILQQRQVELTIDFRNQHIIHRQNEIIADNFAFLFIFAKMKLSLMINSCTMQVQVAQN